MRVDPRGVDVCSDGDGFVLAASGGVSDGGQCGPLAGGASVADGDLSAAAGAGADLSLGPGAAVHGERDPEAAKQAPDGGQHEPPRKLLDNAPAERLFATLKTELVRRRQYRTRDQATREVCEYFEHFYNQRRSHSALGYLSPAAFEARARKLSNLQCVH